MDSQPHSIYPRPAVRTRPVSRIALKGIGPSNLRNNGQGLNQLNLLIYLKDLAKHPASTAKEFFATFLPKSLLDLVEEGAIGLDFEDGYTSFVFGNAPARFLLDEFDDTVDYARNLEANQPDQLMQKFVSNFGHDFVQGRDLNWLVDSAIFMSQRYMIARSRTLNQSVFHDCTLITPHHLHVRNTVRRNIANDVLHDASLAEDAVWALTSDINPTINEFSGTRHWQERHFEAMYRIRVNEAIAIVRQALTPDNPDGTRSLIAHIFCTAIEIINKYTDWRAKIHEVWFRKSLRVPADFLPNEVQHKRVREFLSQRWQSRNGVRLDTAFENFLHSVFNVLEVVERGELIPEPLVHAFNRDRRALLDLIINAQAMPILDQDDISWASHNGLHRYHFPDRLTAETRIPERPPFPLHLFPATPRLQFPREPIILGTLNYFRATRQREREVLSLTAATPPVAPGTATASGSAAGNLASAISGVHDQPSGDDEPEEDTEMNTEGPDGSEDEEDEDTEDYYYRGPPIFSFPPRASTKLDEQKDGGELDAPRGKKASLVDEALSKSAGQLTISGKRRAPMTPSDLPSSKRRASRPRPDSSSSLPLPWNQGPVSPPCPGSPPLSWNRKRVPPPRPGSPTLRLKRRRMAISE
ncbi:hypothetical protein F4776DRAFT_589221 [Hypoxylon sp. NC0597]|nr:hypothetical protein F4776DRAFT_589221 [Hypoxylon sp. NC0597]